MPNCRVALVYTGRSKECARTIVADALAGGSKVRLWALHEIDPELASLTAGSGPGSRLELHNKLLEDADGDEWLVVADDDVQFRHGNVVDLVRAAAMFGLDIAQPAHERGSHVSHPLTRRLPFHAARVTTFVECGPVVAFSPFAARRVLPFPKLGMGWGVELSWHDLQDEGLRLGIVDSVSLVHLFRLASSYNGSPEARQLESLLSGRGLSSLLDIQATLERVPAWRVRVADDRSQRRDRPDRTGGGP